MNSRFGCVVIGAIFALTSFQASAVTYASGENAAGATVVTPTIGRTVASSNVSNISTHLDALVGNLGGGGFGGGGFGGGTISSGLDGGEDKQSFSLFDSKLQNGLAAGEDEKTYSIWANANYTYVDNDKADTQFDGDVKTLNIGADKRFTDNFLAGLSVGYSKTDIDTTYNNGTYEEDAYTLSGYALYEFTDYLNLSGMLGRAWSSIDQDRQNGATTSNLDADTTFAATTLTTSKKFDKVGVSAHLGYLWADRDTDGYIESNANVVTATSAKTDQGRIGGVASYDFAASSVMFTPFVSVDYLHDFSDEINEDANAFDTGLGLKVSSQDGVLEGFFQIKTQLGRDDYSQTSGTAMVRVNF
ncbi:autotransporter outer membrane beta-barrel domain-containing protein [Thalassospira povalilytica]|uniref:autotransporter outer membrane beta-barrel domain-containing protein n=1 Tax=Thalassospira povalilytica TaxID=732237 RepID=UPI0014782374|nr:autotransporter outer membrane beta-barrel domain-containing protein [Thalassospira povalilytica]